MREILFRGKRIDNGEWVEGYYVQRAVAGSECLHWIYPAGSPTISKSLARELRPLHSAKSTQKKVREIFPVDPSTVGQFTGLTDKNGKKIFEGDIVHCVARIDEANCVVIFEEGEFRLVSERCYKTYVTGGGFHALRCFLKEVIGNIHDNPELLEVAE